MGQHLGPFGRPLQYRHSLPSSFLFRTVTVRCIIALWNDIRPVPVTLIINKWLTIMTKPFWVGFFQGIAISFDIYLNRAIKGQRGNATKCT